MKLALIFGTWTLFQPGAALLVKERENYKLSIIGLPSRNKIE